MNSISYCNTDKLIKAFNFEITSEKLQKITKQCWKDVRDAALDHYMPRLNENYIFYYQCLLQALRIVALFHDVGHPPYSHVLESTLNNIYQLCIKEPQNYQESAESKEKIEEIKECLGTYKQSSSDVEPKGVLDQKFMESAFHERVGMEMLCFSLKAVIDQQNDDIIKLNAIEKGNRQIFIIYNILVAEYSLAILCETAPIFMMLHRIISGCIDADRMDYVVRDSINSGVDWGKVPYKRILESARLIERNEMDSSSSKISRTYAVAFPKKLSSDLEDIITTRYRIFSRINFHHRCIKTSMILQRIVSELTRDYITPINKKGGPLCKGIRDMWTCIGPHFNGTELSVIRWNDSMLISHLQETLSFMNENVEYQSTLPSERIEKFNEINEMLNEFLLNKKVYHSVFKRQNDISRLTYAVYSEFLGSLQAIYNKEISLIQDGKVSPGSEDYQCSIDTIERLDLMLGLMQVHSQKPSMDADVLWRLFPMMPHLSTIIEDVLQQFVKDNRIASYLFANNANARNKIGVPKEENLSDSIFVFNDDGKGEIYDPGVLIDKLVALQNDFLLYCAYIRPVEIERENTRAIQKTIIDIRASIVSHFRESMKECICSLWPNLSRSVFVSGSDNLDGVAVI